jgi:hypothetical protein
LLRTQKRRPAGRLFAQGPSLLLLLLEVRIGVIGPARSGRMGSSPHI